MFDDFTTQIQIDEFAAEYEDWSALLEEGWEEPVEWTDDPEPII